MGNDSESQNASHSKDHLLEHFRGITTLIHFATRVNWGRPAIYGRMTIASRRITLSPNYAGLEALAQLTARDDEVIALAVAGYTVDAEDKDRTSLQIAVVAETKDAANTGAIRPGVSRWEEVADDPSAGLVQDLLPDHLATISHALNDHSKDTLTKLIQYVISQNWRKMQSQVTHWSSLSILWKMSLVTKEDLVDAWSAAELRLRRVPVRYLPFPTISTLELEAEVINTLREYSLAQPPNGSFSCIPATVARADGFYEEDCWELHLFLLGLVLLYAELLQSLRESLSLPIHDTDSLRTLIRRIAKISMTLRQIIYTDFFEGYLHTVSVLTGDDFSMDWVSERDARSPQCKDFCKFARSSSPEQWTNQDDDIIGKAFMSSQGRKGILRGWFRAQVISVDSVSTTLQRRHKLKAERLELRLFDVQHPFEAALPDWESLVDSCNHPHLKRNRVKEIFKRKLAEEGPSPSTYPSIFTGTVHCDAALASLVTNEPPPLERASFKEIAVSASCCPVCWKLLSILKSSFPGVRLNIRQPHKTVYPTALPPSLPLEVISEMVEYFQSELVRELRELAYYEGARHSDLLPLH